MKQIPFILIYCRLFIGILIPILTFIEIKSIDVTIVILMVIGLLTDIFDGIIARNQGVSSEKLRIWDSTTDQIFWLFIIGSSFYLHWNSIIPILIPIVILLVLEGLCYLISFYKFNKPIATHSILAKFWTLSLLSFLIELLLFRSYVSFWICFTLGTISRIEIILIVISLKKWTTDVPSILAVRKINNGTTVKKWKLFN